MKVSVNWLKELVDLKISIDELIHLLPLRSISIKETDADSIELDMKGYNRADLLSLRGVAREVAAITDSKIKFEDRKWGQFIFGEIPKVDVQVENSQLCPLYTLTKIENLSVKSSSPDWVKKLSDCGVRSINNIADITNLVMLEFGQPFHAFDADKVKGTVSVRLAKSGEKLLTLDGKNRGLTSEDLVIADENGPIGLAGVMGGKDTEVSDSTTSILLEAAIFDPVNIGKTARRHNLPSEASKRFQHGLTKNNLFQALDEAIRIYSEHGGQLKEFSMIGDQKDSIKTVNLTQQKVNSLIGVDIPKEQVEKSLQSLGFNLEGYRTNSWEVKVPYWRLDIEIEEDLIEEVARMYGYENIPPQELRGKQPEGIDQTLPQFIYDLKKALSEAGLTEVQTYSFYSSAVLNNLNYDKKELIKVANPISSETEYLRDNLWPNLLEVIAKNMRNGIKDVAIFELGKVYSPRKEDLPQEDYRLSIALMNCTDNPIQELNQIWQKITKHLEGEKMQLHLRGEWGKKYFHPTRISDSLAEIHPRYVNKFGVEARVAVLEVEIREPQLPQ